MKDHLGKVHYGRWFWKLARWAPEEKFSLALETHDTPRAVSRFNADAKSLAMLQFLLPSHYPCIYQGQELGLANPKLSSNINDYPGVASRQLYQRLRREGRTKKQAMAIVKQASRDNARQPIDWADYILQDHNEKSVLNFYRQIIKLWREDIVISEGDFKVRRISKRGIFDFDRSYDGKKYRVHIDLSGHTPSTLKNDLGNVILSSK
jgi:glycosidase